MMQQRLQNWLYFKNKTVIYSVNPMFEHLFGLAFFSLFTFYNIYHTFVALWTGQIFIDFLFERTKKAFVKKIKIQRLQRTVSSPPEVDCAKRSKSKKFGSGFFKKDFHPTMLSFLFSTVKCILFVFHPSFISINLRHENVFCRSTSNEPI
jgi:hypothetical protein